MLHPVMLKALRYFGWKLFIGGGVVLFLGGALAAGRYFQVLWTDQTVVCHRGSLDYFLFIDSEPIRMLPSPGIYGAPLFYFTQGDGPKPMMVSVEFYSSLSPSDISRVLQKHLVRNGFTQKGVEMPRIFTRGKDTIQIEIDFESGRTRVFATQSIANAG